MLAEQIKDYINAGFSGLWVQTSEPNESEKEILEAAGANQWRVVSWDVARGVRVQNGVATNNDGGDPIVPIRALKSMAGDTPGILIMHNLHRFLNSAEVMQAVFNQLIDGKAQQLFIIVMSAVVQIPIELEKLFIVIEHDLPNKEQLVSIIRGLDAEFENTEIPQDVIDAAAGLTRYEAEGAFALSLARHDALQADVITELKAATLKKSNLLTLYQGDDDFASLGGLESLKEFCLRALKPKKKSKALPRGVLLLGVSGTGKSGFCKALGNEVRRPVLLADPASWKGSLVGESGQRIRQAFRVGKAMAPAIFFIDEIEKALAGATGYQGDSGVSADQLNVLLKELNDNDGSLFFVATSNDISQLPPEFTRAERWDGVFFLDMPISKEKDLIWKMYIKQYGIEKDNRPDDTDWTGAEIKSCCRLSALLDVSLTQAARNIVPVATTSGEKVQKLREWANGRCLNAGGPGIYSCKADGNTTVVEGKRKIVRRNDNSN